MSQLEVRASASTRQVVTLAIVPSSFYPSHMTPAGVQSREPREVESPLVCPALPGGTLRAGFSRAAGKMLPGAFTISWGPFEVESRPWNRALPRGRVREIPVEMPSSAFDRNGERPLPWRGLVVARVIIRSPDSRTARRVRQMHSARAPPSVAMNLHSLCRL